MHTAERSSLQERINRKNELGHRVPIANPVPFFLVEKSVVMVYNKLLKFTGVTGSSGRLGFVEVHHVAFVWSYRNCYGNPQYRLDSTW